MAEVAKWAEYLDQCYWGNLDELAAIIVGGLPKDTIGGYCEDYPCCGHTNSDPCEDTGLTADDYYKKFSNPDYDPYYDTSDY